MVKIKGIHVQQNDLCFEQVRDYPPDPIIALYQEAGWWTESPKARADIPALIRGSFCLIVVTERGQLIGMGRVISDGVSDGYIHDVFVTERCRKRGIGGQIVQRLAAYCLDKGLDWVGLMAEPGTESFYRQLGFKRLENYQPMGLS